MDIARYKNLLEKFVEKLVCVRSDLSSEII